MLQPLWTYDRSWGSARFSVLTVVFVKVEDLLGKFWYSQGASLLEGSFKNLSALIVGSPSHHSTFAPPLDPRTEVGRHADKPRQFAGEFDVGHREGSVQHAGHSAQETDDVSVFSGKLAGFGEQTQRAVVPPFCDFTTRECDKKKDVPLHLASNFRDRQGFSTPVGDLGKALC